MAVPLAPIGVAVGGAVLSSLFGNKKQYNIPTYSDFYKQYRQEHPQQFGLTSEEFAQAYGGGTELIRAERDAGIARATRGLPQNSVARGLAPIQAASESQRNFAELVGRIQSLHARTARTDKAQYNQEAFQAYGGELQRIQLQMQEEMQSEQFFNNFVGQIVDPIQNYMLMKELDSLDRAQQAKVAYESNSSPMDQMFAQLQQLTMFPSTGGRIPAYALP